MAYTISDYGKVFDYLENIVFPNMTAPFIVFEAFVHINALRDKFPNECVKGMDQTVIHLPDGKILVHPASTKLMIQYSLKGYEIIKYINETIDFSDVEEEYKSTLEVPIIRYMDEKYNEVLSEMNGKELAFETKSYCCLIKDCCRISTIECDISELFKRFHKRFGSDVDLPKSLPNDTVVSIFGNQEETKYDYSLILESARDMSYVSSQRTKRGNGSQSSDNDDTMGEDISDITKKMKQM